jgi:hypothetical protein
MLKEVEDEENKEQLWREQLIKKPDKGKVWNEVKKKIYVSRIWSFGGTVTGIAKADVLLIKLWCDCK